MPAQDGGGEFGKHKCVLLVPAYGRPLVTSTTAVLFLTAEPSFGLKVMSLFWYHSRKSDPTSGSRVKADQSKPVMETRSVDVSE